MARMTSAARRLTVAQFVPALDGGGVEKGTLEVANALVEVGHRSIVVSAGGRLVKPLIATGSEHVPWNLGRKSPLTLLQTGKLRRWLQHESIDIVHARSRMPAWLVYLAWRKLPAELRPRFITTMHGLNSVSRYSKIMSAGERVIAVSETVRSYLLQHYPDTPEEKIVVIPRGIDPDEFPFAYAPEKNWLDAWYKEFPQTRGKWLLTLPGRLTRLKGHHDFLDLISRLKQQHADLHGLIVGGEDPKRQAYARELYDRVKSDGLDAHVTFTGYRSDMKSIYALSQAVLSLSTKPESFGRTVVEAVSLGRAVFGYNHGGVGETLATIYPQGRVDLGDIDSLNARCEALYAGQIKPPQAPQSVYLKHDMLQKTLALYTSMTSSLA